MRLRKNGQELLQDTESGSAGIDRSDAAWGAPRLSQRPRSAGHLDSGSAPARAKRASASYALAAGGKPNILVHHGATTSAGSTSAPTTCGMMGYRTPNIDRIAREGAVFTDWYGQQSCTAGRAAFITGQSPIRTGLTKVGLPGAELGWARSTRAMADVMKTLGLRHRPVRQEPSRRPQRAPADGARLRRVLRQPLSPQRRGGAGEPRLSRRTRRSGRSSGRAASAERRAIATPRRSTPPGKVGKQTIENTGRSTKKRMETIDEEFLAAAMDFINAKAPSRRAVVLLFQLDADARLHASEEGIGGQDRSRASTPTAWWRRRPCRASCCKLVDELGAADNTIVVYTTDNGAEAFTWPDGGSTPFRGSNT